MPVRATTVRPPARAFALRAAATAAAISALALVPGLARAQAVVLQDADVARLLPVLEAATRERDRRDDAVAGMFADDSAATRFHREMTAGRVDLEALLREHVPAALPPPGGTVDAACSRHMTIPGSSGGLHGSLVVVYTLAAEGDTARAGAFYARQGFRTASRNFGSTRLEPPRGVADSLSVGIGRLFRHDGPTGCRHLSGRPVVAFTLDRFGFAEHDRAARPGVSAAVAGRERALARVGLSEERFQELLGAAMVASGDATDPETLAELRTMAEHVADVRPMVEMRLRNADWYRRNRARLEPALGRFLEQVKR